MPPVIFALVPHYAAIFSQMPSTFTAHEFIQKLTQQNQVLYIEALRHYNGGAEPFTTVHQMLGRHLHDFPHLIKKVGSETSKNLFNNDSTVSKWQKI